MSTSRVLRNASLLGVAQAVSIATGFVSTAWLARMLGPDAYGILSFGTAFVSYFALAVVFGTDLYGTREIASSPEKMPALLSRILGYRLILLLLVGVIYIGVISGIDRPRDVIIVMFIQILGLLSAAMTVDFLFQGVQRMGRSRLLRRRRARRDDCGADCGAGSRRCVRRRGDPVSVLIGAVLLGVYAIDASRPCAFLSARGIEGCIGGHAPILLAGLMSLVFLNVDVVMLGFPLRRRSRHLCRDGTPVRSVDVCRPRVTLPLRRRLQRRHPTRRRNATPITGIFVSSCLSARLRRYHCVSRLGDQGRLWRTIHPGAPILALLVMAAILSYACGAADRWSPARPDRTDGDPGHRRAANVLLDLWPDSPPWRNWRCRGDAGCAIRHVRPADLPRSVQIWPVRFSAGRRGNALRQCGICSRKGAQCRP